MNALSQVLHEPDASQHLEYGLTSALLGLLLVLALADLAMRLGSLSPWG